MYFRYHGEWTQHTIFVCQVHCEVRGSLEPPCNAVGFVDRLILGEDHLYQRPVYIRTEVIYPLSDTLFLYWIYCRLKFNLSYLLNDLIRDLFIFRSVVSTLLTMDPCLQIHLDGALHHLILRVFWGGKTFPAPSFYPFFYNY